MRLFLYIVKVHPVLSTFVQRLIEVLLLQKMMLLVFYYKSIFFSFSSSLKLKFYVKKLTFRLNYLYSIC